MTLAKTMIKATTKEARIVLGNSGYHAKHLLHLPRLTEAQLQKRGLYKSAVTTEIEPIDDVKQYLIDSYGGSATGTGKGTGPAKGKKGLDQRETSGYKRVHPDDVEGSRHLKAATAENANM